MTRHKFKPEALALYKEGFADLIVLEHRNQHGTAVMSGPLLPEEARKVWRSYVAAAKASKAPLAKVLVAKSSQGSNDDER